jgi:hypothetical protein
MIQVPRLVGAGAGKTYALACPSNQMFFPVRRTNTDYQVSRSLMRLTKYYIVQAPRKAGRKSEPKTNQDPAPGQTLPSQELPQQYNHPVSDISEPRVWLVRRGSIGIPAAGMERLQLQDPVPESDDTNHSRALKFKAILQLATSGSHAAAALRSGWFAFQGCC